MKFWHHHLANGPDFLDSTQDPDFLDSIQSNDFFDPAQGAAVALSPSVEVAFQGSDATMGTLTDLAKFMITGYWASAAGGMTGPRQWQSHSVSCNITSLTPTDQVLARDALADWATVCNLTFTFTTGTANITYTDNPGSAFASPTLSGKFMTSVDVNIPSNFGSIGGGPDGVGGYQFQTYIHEIGHALGLGHTGPYNFQAVYGVNNVFTNDTWKYSVMSYFPQSDLPPATLDEAVTPQMADILAVQTIYGAPTTSVGNTTYGFGSTAGAIYNFALYPLGSCPAFTIYNTGANNTLNASGYSVNQVIDLRPGDWSSIGGQVDNIGIYTTTNIANAVAGSGNDTIIPNGLLTRKGALTGGSGNDTFVGTQAGLNQYTISDLHVGDKINLTDANLATFTFNLTGSTLNYSNNLHITLSNNLVSQFAVSADPVSGIDLIAVPATNSSLSGRPPVSISALTALQQGIQFFTNPAEATAEATLINATPTTESVFTYAAKLINGQISLAQVAMADSALMEGGTVGIGNTTTPNTLTLFSTVFLPAQVANALAHGFNPTVYAAEALGLALGGNTNFNTNFVAPFATNVLGFAQAVSTAAGVKATAIQGFVNNWVAFYTANPSATRGLTVTQAAYGAAFGDAVGSALVAPTSLNLPLTTIFSTTANNGFSPNTVMGLVANALIDIAEDTANGTPGTLYKTGVPLLDLTQHAPLQGEFQGGVEQTGSSGQSNSIINGAFGGAHQTLTPGDTITAAAGATSTDFDTVVVKTGTFGPSISYSNNAAIIDASTSSGLIMQGGDANFVAAATAGASLGDTITGATNPVGTTLGTGATVGDLLAGSIGNDTITSKSLTFPDIIATNGGSDTIKLGAGHTGLDHVEFYAGDGQSNGGGVTVYTSVASAITSAVGGTEVANPGWWGVGAGGTSLNLGTMANGTGVSSDVSTLTGLNIGQDFVDFSAQAWGKGASVFGLTANNATTLVTASGFASAEGTAVNAKALAPGGAINGTAAAPADLIVLSQDSFLNAATVASDLVNGTYTLTHSKATAGTNYDFLLAYQNPNGDTVIADLHIGGGAGGTTSTAKDVNVAVSDIVTLVGVSIPTMLANADHIHLVS